MAPDPFSSPETARAGSRAEGSGARRERFEALALPHLEVLYRTALRMVGSAPDAEDLVQETFLRAYRTFDNFRPGTDGKAWLFTILYSIVSNLRRSRRRRPPPRSLAGRPEEEGSEGVEIADWTGYEEIIGNPRLHWEGSEAEGAVRALPPRLGHAVLLVDVAGLSYEEAARVIECPVGTVRSRLYRARRRLAGRLRALAAAYGLVESES